MKNNSIFTYIAHLSKGFYITLLAGIVGVGLCGGGAYFYFASKTVTPISTQSSKLAQSIKPSSPTPTVDPYAGWKTYNDSYNQFSFKYPSDWSVVADDSQQSGLANCHQSYVTITTSGGDQLTFGYNLDNCAFGGFEPVLFTNNDTLTIGKDKTYKALVDTCDNPAPDNLKICKNYVYAIAYIGSLSDQRPLNQSESGNPYPTLNGKTSSIYMKLAKTLSLNDPAISSLSQTVDNLLKSVKFNQSDLQPQNGSQIISIDNTYDKYLNYDLSVSITYSSTVAGNTGCDSKNGAQEGSTPTKVIEDFPENRIYVAASQVVYTTGHQISPGVYGGNNDSCKVSTTTLDDIKNKADGIANNKWLVYQEISYGTVNSEASLDSFVNPFIYLFNGEVSLDHTKSPTVNGDVFSYPFKIVIGTDYASPPAAQWFNLLYDPKKKVAVYWETVNTQAPIWSGKDSKGNFVDINPPTADIIE